MKKLISKLPGFAEYYSEDRTSTYRELLLITYGFGILGATIMGGTLYTGLTNNQEKAKETRELQDQYTSLKRQLNSKFRLMDGDSTTFTPEEQIAEARALGLINSNTNLGLQTNPEIDNLEKEIKKLETILGEN